MVVRLANNLDGLMSKAYDTNAWLYDAAFSWDVMDEVCWLVGRFGPDTRSVLEPACGSGRLLEGLVRVGLDVAGFDRSEVMLDRARKRFESLGLPVPALRAGMLEDCAAIDFEQRFDAAVLPIGTFGYLQDNARALAHLEGVAWHLAPGSRYMIQFELKSLATFELRRAEATTCWDTPSPRGTVRCSVFGKSFDPVTCIETEIQRYEVLDGPDAGLVDESEHPMRVWDYEAWRALIDASPFVQDAAWNGDEKGRPELALDSGLEAHKLVWHELRLPLDGR